MYLKPTMRLTAHSLSQHEKQQRIRSAEQELIEQQHTLEELSQQCETSKEALDQKEKALNIAKEKANKVRIKKQELELAYQAKLKLSTENNNTKETPDNMLKVRDQWNEKGKQLAELQVSNSERLLHNQQMNVELSELERENRTMVAELSNINQHKRIQAEEIIAGRKRLKALETEKSDLQKSNKICKQNIEALDRSAMEAYRLELLRESCTTLTSEIESLRKTNAEVALQSQLQVTLLADVNTSIKETQRQINEVKANIEEVREDSRLLEQQIEQIDEEMKNLGEPGEEWTPELHELWRECMRMRNKNKHLAKDISELQDDE